MQAQIEAKAWRESCQQTHDIKDLCLSTCESKIISQKGHCCNNICSDIPCVKEQNILSNNDSIYCLYDKHCSNNTNYSKQFIKINKNETCPQDLYNRDIITCDTESEAIEWISKNNDCE